MYNKTIIRFDFCDIQNNRGLGKGYQLRLRLITPTSTSIILDITETSSNNCLKTIISEKGIAKLWQKILIKIPAKKM